MSSIAYHENTKLVVREAKLGEIVRWYDAQMGSAQFGRVLKINKKTYNVSDEKFGTDDIYQVSKSVCKVVEFYDKEGNRVEA